MKRDARTRLARWALLVGPVVVVALGYAACLIPRRTIDLPATNSLEGAGIVIERGAVRLSAQAQVHSPWPERGLGVQAGDGNFAYAVDGPVGDRKPKWWRPWEWWPRVERFPWVTVVTIPLWLGLLPAALGGWLAWRGRRLTGRCGGCGYERAGLAVEAVCPECGLACG